MGMQAWTDAATPALAALAADAAPRPDQRARLAVRVRSPRAQARRLLALGGVRGEAQFRALATLWTLAVSSRATDGSGTREVPAAVDADAVGERLGLPGAAVSAAVDDLVRVDLLRPDGARMRLRPLEGLDEAVANLSRLMLRTG